MESEQRKAYRKAWRARPENKAKEREYSREYEKNVRSRPDGYNKSRKNYLRSYYLKNSDRQHSEEIKRKYGIDGQTYNDMLISQNGLCAICLNPPHGNRRLAVDHDHTTGKVRSLLCVNCNTALGSVKENKLIVSRLFDYISKHESK